MKEIVFVDIDTQFDFMIPEGKLYVKGAKGIIPNLKRLTQMAAKNDILIISSVDTHIKNDPEFKQFPPHCVMASKGQKKIPPTLLKRHIFIPERILSKQELRRKIKGYRQLIVQKNNVYTFMDLNLLRIFKPFKIAFVYGVALDYCVRAAVLDLLKAGLRVNLVVDAAPAIDPSAGKFLLAQFKKGGVKLMRTKEAVSEIKKYEQAEQI